MDLIVDQWRAQRPDLDPAAKQLTGRVIRLGALFQGAYSEAFAPLRLSEGDYGVLVALRRAGAPHRLTPTDLARQQMMTSGGMTAAIDRLERKGFVTRLPNPNDRRGSLVELTDEGRHVVDQAMERHAEAERRLVRGLNATERKTLEQLLRKWLRSVDESEA
ncbi:MAG: MarR family transcriptional regulator [Actinomycetota bacterium]|nr:MarR family transcriptional regulator [Actinomycetota bacterium]